ncbi:ABC transporter substrate-binding protein [Amycolatopsis sp. cmx-11-12]|uniref:ABC transporter substrate-binding protein n=1 Tax=Amycolatopsis sp. cmx-11-12 TaxID=2785795 RepID=UPI0039185EF0
MTAGCAATKPDVAAGGVTLENCGAQVRVDKPPRRVVTLDQQTTETLLTLGLREDIAGTALQSGPVSEEHRAEYATIPMISSQEVTGEQLRAADPDFVISAFVSRFTREQAGTRAELADLGLPSYVSEVDCPKYQPDKTPFERLFTDYENFGTIFGVRQRAAGLIGEQRAVVADAEKAAAARAAKPTVAYLYSVHNGTPWVAGGSGMPANLSRVLGAKNVFDDVDRDWAEVGWDQIVARNPSVIVIADLPGRGQQNDTAQEKIQLMRAHPVLSQLDAVRTGRFVTVPGLELDATVRSVNALKTINDGLAKLA